MRKSAYYAFFNGTPCYGCNKLEIAEFKGVSRCKDFVSAVADYQEKIREELKVFAEAAGIAI